MHYLDLILYKTVADLRAEANRGYLGMLWWVIEPIMYMFVFYVVFTTIELTSGSNFVTFLLCGLVFWKWFASTVTHSANSIVSNVGLIRQVYLPKVIFPVIVIFTNSFKFSIILIIFLLFLILAEGSVSITWLSLPVLLFVQLLLISSIGIMLAAIIPFVPDLNLIIDNILMMLFFLSGIFFDISTMPEQTQFYLHMNPMAIMIENYRIVLLGGNWPDWSLLGIVTLFSSMGILVSVTIIHRFDRVYPKAIWV